MPDSIPYASTHSPAPTAWCLRCGATCDAVPPARKCPACGGDLALAHTKRSELRWPIGAVLRLSEVAIVGPVVFVADAYPAWGFELAAILLGLAWITVLRFIAVLLHVVALGAAASALRKGERERTLLCSLIALGLALSAIGFAGDLLPPIVSRRFQVGTWINTGIVGVALAQFAVFRALAGSLSRAAKMVGPVRLGQISAAVLFAWPLAACLLDLAPLLTNLPIVMLMLFNIWLLYRARCCVRAFSPA